MVESQDIRDAFAARLNKALDGAAGIRPERGRNTDLHTELSKLGVSATKQATHKWLTGASIPERSHIEKLAKWLGVRTEWLEYGQGEMMEAAHSSPSSADIVRKMLEKHGKSLTADARNKIVEAVESEAPPLVSLGGDELAVIRVRPGELSIPQYDVRGSMGAGEIPDDYVRHIRNVIISEDMVREMALTYTSPTNLCFMTGSGQSMEGTINDKSPLLVDRGVQSFIGDGVYAFTWEGFFNVKRLQLLDSDHVEIISDNPTYQPRKARIEDLFVHARVLVAWNARKL